MEPEKELKWDKNKPFKGAVKFFGKKTIQVNLKENETVELPEGTHYIEYTPKKKINVWKI